MAARKTLCKLLSRHRFNSPRVSKTLNKSQTPFCAIGRNGKPSVDHFFNTLSPLNGFSGQNTTVFAPLGESILGHSSPWNVKNQGLHSLGDQRLPKRRPSTKRRKKRAALRPRGPHRWIIYKEGEPIPPSRPNEGSVRRRKHRKRMEQRAAFRSREAKKRKDQLAAARRRKAIKKIERKMAAVARDRAWAERLAQLKQAEVDAGQTPA
ncbi:hypothetical protein KI387_001134 [Taxus chinensis]|uniref:Uncharacterized protein n=1 Tax=Taxus chinensis TaxID=29808 RepID=A0AA38GU22_TAXCH|nr:hypothetical protein KI387_001134 [Taxus chinensis]